MATQQELDKVYMSMAESIATLSKARRNKVGCVLVTPENVMLSSYNGTPRGWDNRCEDAHETELFEHLVTKPTVIHVLIMRLAPMQFVGKYCDQHHQHLKQQDKMHH